MKKKSQAKERNKNLPAERSKAQEDHVEGFVGDTELDIPHRSDAANENNQHVY